MARIPFYKRISLAGVYEHWDETCYALIKPATVKDRQDASKLDPETMTVPEQLEYQHDLIKSHFLGGKINVMDDETGETKLDDLTLEDVAESTELSDRLFLDIMGLKYDPKDSGAAAPNEQLPAESSTPTDS